LIRKNKCLALIIKESKSKNGNFAGHKQGDPVDCSQPERK